MSRPVAPHGFEKRLVIVAVAVFLLIRVVNQLRQQEAAKQAEPPSTPEEVLLLREIRDALKK